MGWKRLVNIGMKLAAIAGALYIAYWPLAHLTLDDDEFRPAISFPNPFEYIEPVDFVYWISALCILALLLWALATGANRLTNLQRGIALGGAILFGATLFLESRQIIATLFSHDMSQLFFAHIIGVGETLAIGGLLYYTCPASVRTKQYTANWFLGRVLQNLLVSLAGTIFLFIFFPAFVVPNEHDAGLAFVLIHHILLFILNLFTLFILISRTLKQPKMSNITEAQTL